MYDTKLNHNYICIFKFINIFTVFNPIKVYNYNNDNKKKKILLVL